jgi:maleate isomerase
VEPGGGGTLPRDNAVQTRPAIAPVARIGLVVPSINTCSEPQFRALAPPGVEFFATRVRLQGADPDQLLAAAEAAVDAADLLADLDPDLILFHCTAASVIGGRAHAEDLERRLVEASGRPTTATATAIVEALDTVGARRVTVVAPYGRAVTELEADFLREWGLEVAQTVALDVQPVASYPERTPAEWADAVMAAVSEPCGAVLLSCTNIRAIEAIAPLEEALRVPVITSNQAGVWYVLRRLGIDDPIPGAGQLMAECAPA